MIKLIFKLQLLTFLAFSFYSCSNNVPKQRIPYVKVRFPLYLNGSSENDLKNIGSYQSYTNQGVAGVLVINSPVAAGGYGYYAELPVGGYLYAYDKCCPHENNPISYIEVTSEGKEGICRSCKTKYDLWNAGTVISGVGKYPLQLYRVSPTNLANLMFEVTN